MSLLISSVFWRMCFSECAFDWQSCWDWSWYFFSISWVWAASCIFIWPIILCSFWTLTVVEWEEAWDSWSLCLRLMISLIISECFCSYIDTCLSKPESCLVMTLASTGWQCSTFLATSWSPMTLVCMQLLSSRAELSSLWQFNLRVDIYLFNCQIWRECCLTISLFNLFKV